MQEFKDQRILVVGGAGFVGSNLVKQLLKCQPKEVIVVDNLLSAERENLPLDPAVTFIEASITDDKALTKLQDNIDYVFHLATFHGNQNSISRPLDDHENNTFTTLRLYERIKDFKQIKKVVYSSAGCVVAEKTFSKAKATTEDTMPSLFLDSPYQISKIIGEFYSNYYFQRYNLPVVKARFQNVYGPGEVLGAGQWRGTIATVWRNVIPTFVYQALKQKALTVENGGIATRDFIYVEDIARGLMCCAIKGTPSESYNLASGVETPIKDLAETINKLTNNPTPLELKPKRAWDNSGTRYGSVDKANKELGFLAEVSLEEGLQRTVSWTKANLPFIEGCMSKHHAFAETA